MEKESQFEKGKRELKEIREKLKELREKQRSIQGNLKTAMEQRQKLFGDVALGLRDPGEKAKVNQEIRELGGKREGLDITIKELEVREIRLDRGGYGKFYSH